MSLLARIRAARCAVVDCEADRAPDAEVCRNDLTWLWRHLLDRQPDGTYTRRRQLGDRDFTGQIRSAA